MAKCAPLSIAGYMLLFVVLVLNPVAARGKSSTLLLTPGQQKTIDAPEMSRIAVGNPSIADVKAIDDTKQVLVTAVGLGQTDIIIWDDKNRQRSIKVQVVESDPATIAREIGGLLQGVEGIIVKTLGSRVIIDGKLLRREDLNKIRQIATLYPQVANFATLSPAVINAVIDQLNIGFKEAGLTNITAIRLGNQVVVQGEVPAEDDLKKIEMIASAFELKIKNFVKVGFTLEKMILVNVDFVEIFKDKLNNIGINWDDAINFTGDVEVGDNSSFTLNSSYGATINLLSKNSNAHIIARPKLLCKNGEKAEFLAGGQVPVITSSMAGQSVTYKSYGIILEIAPRVDDNGNIATEITVENSSVGAFNKGQPSFQTARVKTNFNVKSGQMIVLSGLVNREQAKAVDRLPGLGHVPILGELFKSRSFQSNQSELVVFVTPELMSPEHKKNKQAIQAAHKANQDVEKDFKFKLMD